MPMHDWTRVDAGIYHAFHHEWISEIHRAVMKRLPEDYYSLPEQQAAGFGPDVLTLKFDDEDSPSGRLGSRPASLAESDRRSQRKYLTAAQKKTRQSDAGRIVNMKFCS